MPLNATEYVRLKYEHKSAAELQLRITAESGSLPNQILQC